MATHRSIRKWPYGVLISLLSMNWAMAVLPPGFTGEAFFKTPALEQQEVIWKEIEESAYKALPPQDQAPDYDLDLLSNPANLVKVFQYDSIVMPEGRAKATQQFGSAAAP